MQRLTAIDSLRGLLLVLMTINHMPGPHRVYTFDSIGYFTVAEGFVFISGLVAGLHGSRLLLTKSEENMRGVFYRRARTLYLSQLLLLGLLFATGLLISQMALSPWARHHPLLVDYSTSWANRLHPLYVDPGLAALAAAVLVYQPPLFDVLPMYCFFLFFTPFFLLCIHRGRTAWLLAGSFLLWLGAQTQVVPHLLTYLPSRWYIHDLVFDPVGWQILFVLGVTSGALWFKYQPAWRPHYEWLAFMVVLAGLGFFCRHAPVPEATGVIMGNLSYRGSIAPLRLVSTCIVLAGVGLWALRFPRAFTWAPLVQLGRNSLYIFLFQIAVVYFADPFCDRLLLLPHGGWLNALAIIVFTSLLWPAAWCFDRMKERRRAAEKLAVAHGKASTLPSP